MLSHYRLPPPVSWKYGRHNNRARFLLPPIDPRIPPTSHFMKPAPPATLQKYLLQWAPGQDGTVRTLINTAALEHDRGKNRLMVVCRIVDPSIDEMLDTR